MSKEKEADQDLPSDFFDEFSKPEFMAGLDVVDSWDVENKKAPRGSDGDPDLRALLRTRKEEAAAVAHRSKRDRSPVRGRRHTSQRRSGTPERRSCSPQRRSRSPQRRSRSPQRRSRSPQRRSRSPQRHNRSPGRSVRAYPPHPPRFQRSPHRSRRTPDRPQRKRSPDLEHNAKTGSRRDVEKTNRDIKKDKEQKVKEYLAKRLDDANGDIGPPGTELEDYLDGVRKRERKFSGSPMQFPRASRRRNTPTPPLARRRRSSSRRNSRTRRSKSPDQSDTFLYPVPQGLPFHGQVFPSHENFNPQMHSGFPTQGPYSFQPDSYYPPSGPGPSPYIQGPTYNNFNYGPGVPMNMQQAPYEFDPVPPVMVPAPSQMAPASQQIAPVPQQMAPVLQQMAPSPQQMAPAPQQMVPAPQPVPAPVPLMSMSVQSVPHPLVQGNTRDALDQLLAEGKISKEDYLKLTPKGRPITAVNLKEKVYLLARCHDAVTKLSKLHLPNRLIMSNLFLGPEQKAIATKFCSPLKRQQLVKFQFTTPKNASVLNQNKQLVDSIIGTIELQQIVAKPSKKQRSQFKDACVQTMTPFCESCDIRLATKYETAATMIDLDHFTNTVHTQVIDVEMASSKTMFTPGGNASDSMSHSMSMSHLTSAQLIVSQLAARAKKLENVPPEADGDAFGRRRNAGMSSQGNNVPYHYSQGNQGSSNYRY